VLSCAVAFEQLRDAPGRRRLVNGVGDHDIDCKVEGFGAMQLRSSVVKKA